MEYAMLIFWIVLLVVLIIIEAVTAQLVTIWFAAGAAAALVAELCGLEQWLQWVIFIAVSAVALVAFAPALYARALPPQRALCDIVALVRIGQSQQPRGTDPRATVDDGCFAVRISPHAP